MSAMRSRFAPDRQLTVRMVTVIVLLGLLYAAFVLALIALLKDAVLVVVIAAAVLPSSTGTPTGSPCSECGHTR
jgi:hypothetical protein